MAEQVQEEDGITLGQIFKAMFHNKKRYLIILCATFIVVFFGIILLYNNPRKQYVANFKYSDVNISNGRYSDGSKFNMLDIIDLMEDVKASNPKYSSIDVDKILSNNSITVSEEITTRKSENDTATDDKANIITSTYFSLKINKSAISSKLVKDFITDLIVYPIKKSNEYAKTIVFDENLKLFNASTIYNSQVSYLIAQKDLLTNGYQSLIDTYGDLSIDGTRLSSKLKEINLYFDNNKISTMNAEIQSKGYVKDIDSYRIYVESQLYSLRLDLKSSNDKLQKLTSQRDALVASATQGSGTIQSVELSTYNDNIISLTQQIVDLEQQIEIFERYNENNDNSTKYTPEELSNFEERLTAYSNKLQEITEQYKNDYLNCLDKYDVYYNEASKVTVTGGFNTAITLLLSVLIAFVVACIANMCVNHNMLSKDYVEPKKQVEEIFENKEE